VEGDVKTFPKVYEDKPAGVESARGERVIEEANRRINHNGSQPGQKL